MEERAKCPVVPVIYIAPSIEHVGGRSCSMQFGHVGNSAFHAVFDMCYAISNILEDTVLIVGAVTGAVCWCHSS